MEKTREREKWEKLEKPKSSFERFRYKIEDCRVGIVNACFYPEYSHKLLKGAKDVLHKVGVSDILELETPGSWEIPLAIKFLIDNKNCHGVIALGILIRGETSHYDLICKSVERSCSEIQLKYECHVSFGLLTAENREQVLERCGGKKGHRGEEAAQALISLHQSVRKLI